MDNAPDGVVVDEEDALDAIKFGHGQGPRLPVVREDLVVPLCVLSLPPLGVAALALGERADECGHDGRALEHEALVAQGAPGDESAALCWGRSASERVGCRLRRRRRRWEEEVEEAQVGKQVVVEGALGIGQHVVLVRVVVVEVVGELDRVPVGAADPPGHDAVVAQLAREVLVARDDEDLGRVCVSCDALRGLVGLAVAVVRGGGPPLCLVAEEAQPVVQEGLEGRGGEGDDEGVLWRRCEVREDGQERRERRVERRQRRRRGGRGEQGATATGRSGKGGRGSQEVHCCQHEYHYPHRRPAVHYPEREKAATARRAVDASVSALCLSAANLVSQQRVTLVSRTHGAQRNARHTRIGRGVRACLAKAVGSSRRGRRARGT